MGERAELTEDEYHNQLTELAKDGIREFCVTDSGEVVDNSGRVAYEFESVEEFANQYPLSVLEHAKRDEWWDDSHELVGHYDPSRTAEHIITRIARQDVMDRTKELLDGEWDAIQQETETREVTETKTVFNDS